MYIYMVLNEKRVLFSIYIYIYIYIFHFFSLVAEKNKIQIRYKIYVFD